MNSRRNRTLFLIILCASAFVISQLAEKRMPDSDIKLVQLSTHTQSQMMGYILTDGENTIVVDGGKAEDADALQEYVKTHTVDGDVDLWLVTHYHNDHTGALSRILKDTKDPLAIKQIVFNFPEQSSVESYEPNRLNDYLQITDSLSNQTNTTEAGENAEYTLGPFKIKIVQTYQPGITGNFGNNSSTVYKVTLDDFDILFLGDTGTESGERLITEHSSDLTGIEMVQMAHHGQAGVSQDVYQLINPDYCLWPAPMWLYEDPEGHYLSAETRQWMDELNVKKIYVGEESPEEINLSELLKAEAS